MWYDSQCGYIVQQKQNDVDVSKYVTIRHLTMRQTRTALQAIKRSDITNAKKKKYKQQNERHVIYLCIKHL